MKFPNTTKKKYEHMVESKKSATRSHIQKITAGSFFPFAYILSRYLTGKYVSERGICFLRYALFSSQCHYMTLK